MRKSIGGVVILVLLAMASPSFGQCGGAAGTQTEPATAQADSSHVLLTPKDVKWGPAPPALPAGAQAAVIDGDPAKAGAAYTIRLKFPKGYRVPPHWHPLDESVTVIEGMIAIGLGDKFNEAAGHDLSAGSYARMPKGMRHFAWAKAEAIIQVHGVGPFEITYVNPADDPRSASRPK